MSVSLATELTLHSYIPLTSLLFQGPEQKKKGKKEEEIWSTLSPHLPWRKCYRLADGIQRNKTGKTDRATDGQEDVSQIASVSQTDTGKKKKERKKTTKNRQAEREAESPQRDRQANCWKDSLALYQVT